MALIDAASSAGCPTRLLGGTAIAAICPSASRPGLAREYGDIDVVTRHEHSRALGTVIESFGYTPNRRFNALHGRARMLYYGEEGQHLDVFVDTFALCHRLALRDRLELFPVTLAPADLLLTKLQIAELNFKDVQDLAALLVDYDVGGAPAAIDKSYICREIVCADWGWWRTVTSNLERLAGWIGELEIAGEAKALTAHRIGQLAGAIDSHPKSVRWRIRAVIGAHMAWREEPEEVQ